MRRKRSTKDFLAPAAVAEPALLIDPTILDSPSRAIVLLDALTTHLIVARPTSKPRRAPDVPARWREAGPHLTRFNDVDSSSLRHTASVPRFFPVDQAHSPSPFAMPYPASLSNPGPSSRPPSSNANPTPIQAPILPPSRSASISASSGRHTPDSAAHACVYE